MCRTDLSEHAVLPCTPVVLVYSHLHCNLLVITLVKCQILKTSKEISHSVHRTKATFCHEDVTGRYIFIYFFLTYSAV